MLSGIRWWWVLLGAVLTELSLFVLVVPLYMLPNGATIVLYIVGPACLAAAFVFGWWTARRAGASFALHGTLVGIAASLIYIAMTWSKTLPLVYSLSHILKVIGGAAGGLLAARQAQKSATPAEMAT